MYQASFFYKPSPGALVFGNQLTVGFRDVTGETTYGRSTVDVSAVIVGDWSKLTVPIVARAAAPTSNNTFFIEFPRGTSGDFAFNLISCFPPTFKGRLNRARRDIANAFLELKPGFIRLPGGNDLEGRSISSRFIWNHTIGPLEQRPGRKGTWTDFNTEGFGLLELLTFAEDISAAPVLAVYAGFSLDQVSVPEDKLQPYIDEVIDEIDFRSLQQRRIVWALFKPALADENPSISATSKSVTKTSMVSALPPTSTDGQRTTVLSRSDILR